MKVGLIGFESSGKTTLYRAAAQGHAKGDVTAVPVPDPRFDRIVAQVQPKKATPATVILHDDLDSIHGSAPKMFSQRFLDDARKMEVLLHVVRAFDSPVAPFYGDVDPLRDQTRVDEELLLADLQIIETRLEKLAKSANAKNPGHIEYLERTLFERIKEPLEMGRPIREMDLSEEEQTLARNFQMLSAKQMVVAFNVPESEAAQPSPRVQERIGQLSASGTPAFAVCATIEDELAQLDEADQSAFLSDLGLEESASAKVVRAVYQAMGLITFYTAGENETRAWPLRRGSTALKAASVIHTDIARGFIRAEVVHYKDYDECGSWHAAHAHGRMVLEGKDHVIEDGDLIHIRNKV